MGLLRLYLVVHDGSQAHNADVHVISLVGWMGLLMHLVSQRGTYSAEPWQAYGHMNRCFKKKDTIQMVWSEHSRPIITQNVSAVPWTSTVSVWQVKCGARKKEILRRKFWKDMSDWWWQKLKRLSWFWTPQFFRGSAFWWLDWRSAAEPARQRHWSDQTFHVISWSIDQGRLCLREYLH